MLSAILGSECPSKTTSSLTVPYQVPEVGSVGGQPRARCSKSCRVSWIWPQCSVAWLKLFTSQ